MGAARWEDEMSIKGHVQQRETAAGTMIPTLHIAGCVVHRQQLSGKTGDLVLAKAHSVLVLSGAESLPYKHS